MQGNRIGTKADGTGDLGNGGAGVRALGSDNLIGGSTSPAGNAIANSGGDGVEWFFPDAAGDAGQGNAIIGNGSHGVSVKTGPASVLGNVIVANGGDGVENRFGREVQIQGNQIFGNTGLGIDLAGGTNGDGVTPNDNDDPDTGSNDRQTPVLAQAVRNTQGVTIVSGTLNSNPSKTYPRIELFIAATDPSGSWGGPNPHSHSERQHQLEWRRIVHVREQSTGTGPCAHGDGHRADDREYIRVLSQSGRRCWSLRGGRTNRSLT